MLYQVPALGPFDIFSSVSFSGLCVRKDTCYLVRFQGAKVLRLTIRSFSLCCRWQLFLLAGWLGPWSSLVPVRLMPRSALVFAPLVLRHIVHLSGFSLRPARVLSSPRQPARIISQAFPRQTCLFVSEVFATFVACLSHFYLCTRHVREFPLSLFVAHSARVWYEFVGAVLGRVGVGHDATTCGRPHLLRSFTCCSRHLTPSPRPFLPCCLVRAKHFSEKKPAIYTQGGGFFLHITFSPSMYRLRCTCVSCVPTIMWIPFFVCIRHIWRF